jgi:hypothetical protein
MAEECLAEECGERFTGLFPCQTFPCHLRPFPSSVFALVAAARAVPLSRCAFAFVSGFPEYECDGFVIRRRLAMAGQAGCDGKWKNSGKMGRADLPAIAPVAKAGTSKNLFFPFPFCMEGGLERGRRKWRRSRSTQRLSTGADSRYGGKGASSAEQEACSNAR